VWFLPIAFYDNYGLNIQEAEKPFFFYAIAVIIVRHAAMANG
jgi:hypothetical protein